MHRLAIVAAAGAALTVSGCMVETPAVTTTYPAPVVSAPVASYPAMPPPRVEVIPARPAGERWVWVKGHWRWNGARYVWVQGRYERRPVAATHWEPGHWARRGGGWVWISGHWA